MRRTLILLPLAVALAGGCVPVGPVTSTIPVTEPTAAPTDPPPDPTAPTPPTVVPPAATPGPAETSPSLTESLPWAGSEPVTRNADWTPMIQAFDGVEMALVPAGCLPMGSSEEQVDDATRRCERVRGAGMCERGWYEHEQPVHTVCFDLPFWIDVYEVTNGQYGSAGTWTGDRLPREGVNWADAAAHCAGRGARLPTEAEWEYAARGPDGLVFPWGDGFKGSLLNWCDRSCEWNMLGTGVDDGYAHTAPVGSYPEGASWVGALDMSGNVWEWTSSIYGPYPNDAADGLEEDGGADGESRRVLRGGSWYHSGTDLLRSAARYPVSPEYADYVVGFRCVASNQ